MQTLGPSYSSVVINQQTIQKIRIPSQKNLHYLWRLMFFSTSGDPGGVDLVSQVQWESAVKDQEALLHTWLQGSE